MSISSRVAFASPEMTIRDSHGAFPYNLNPDTDINAMYQLCKSQFATVMQNKATSLMIKYNKNTVNIVIL